MDTSPITYRTPLADELQATLNTAVTHFTARHPGAREVSRNPYEVIIAVPERVTKSQHPLTHLALAICTGGLWIPVWIVSHIRKSGKIARQAGAVTHWRVAVFVDGTTQTSRLA